MFDFKIGQEVVCIDASSVTLLMLDVVPVSPLIEGATYTIRGIQYDPASSSWGVYLEEIVLPVLDFWKDRGPTEPPWRASRFRAKEIEAEQVDNRRALVTE